MKVIFLDFDGVLNSSGSAILHQSSKSFMFQARPNPVSVSLVESLIKKTGAYVVISSSWRQNKTIEELKSILITDFGFTNADFVLDKTGNDGSRTSQILNWIKTYKPKEFVILDDEDLQFEKYAERFVKTDFDEGFCFGNYKKALELFGYNIGII